MVSPREFVYGYHPATGEPVTDLDEFEALLRDVEARRVARDEVPSNLGTYVVSTVHVVTNADVVLRVDAPRLWQTAVSGPGGVWLPSWERNYATRDEAETGHTATLVAVRLAVGALL